MVAVAAALGEEIMESAALTSQLCAIERVFALYFATAARFPRATLFDFGYSLCLTPVNT